MNAKLKDLTVTPDCESVNRFNQLNLLPAQTETMQESGEGNASSISGDAITHQENEQGIGNVENSGVVGNNLSGDENVSVSGSNNEVSTQTYHVQENYGVTGITGTGHTINIYQYPKELAELLAKLKIK